MQIISNQIRDLVASIEAADALTPSLDEQLKELVGLLKVACAHPEVIAKYQRYNLADCSLEPLPMNEDGYIVAFDPLLQEEEFFQCWSRYGIVASAKALSPAQSERTIATVHHLTSLISEGRCDLSRPETWSHMPVDDAGASLLSRGFFEIYHDDVLAALRQSVRVYLHYVLIWGRHDLWTTFDRLGVKLPGHEESRALPLHVDQNPNVHPSFRTVQGVLALSDCPLERGTFVGVPGSKKHFMEYGSMAKNNGEYVELDMSKDIAKTLKANAQACPMRSGDLISWDSRTTHANSENFSQDTRVVAYIACGIACNDNAKAVEARANGFKTGLGSNVREAMMHASKPPRYTSPATIARVRTAEKLTILGSLLYGLQRYEDV